jgi:Tfp pilus assembly protein FimV
MRSYALSMTLFAGFMLVISDGHTEEPQTPKAKALTSNQLLMRDKLVQMNRVLEGITLDNYEQVQESAELLRMISRATSWHVNDPTPQYKRLSENFQEQAADLLRHAKDRSVEAATLDLVRMNITCTQCHQHMRDAGARGE